jgi:predicted nucleic acid-binding protein
MYFLDTNTCIYFLEAKFRRISGMKIENWIEKE